MDIIKMIEDEQLRKDIPEFNVGDTVQVHYKVIEEVVREFKYLKVLSLKDKVEELLKPSL